MKQYFYKARLVAAVAAGSLAIVMAVTAPQALAHDAQARERIIDLENKLEAIQNELGRVKSDSERTRSDSDRTSQEVTRLEELTTSVKKRQEKKRHMVFFRGGWARSNETHNGVSIESRVVPVVAQDRADRDAWYIGAGLDFSLTEDAWGLVPRTEILAEIMFEYKNFQTGVLGNGLANEPTPLTPIDGAANPRGVTVSQFTLTASPKIKFLAGSKFRPWIIPAGLAIHVLSPPSESITVLDPGVMFGAGADYNIWENIYIGADARYHLTVGTLDGAKIDGLTVGGYLGMGF